ncbi:MAG TPA: phosphoribosylamine--glycine ligase [Polyangiaceae bacterium]|nr:phosphoribosylamine--glycine ligase [Polyangiaceae bacterium]
MGKKVLVVGSGGREHALALALLNSPSVSEVHVAPGNAGTDVGRRADGKLLCNVAGDPLGAAQALRADLVVVGPEVPLCEGLADQLVQAKIPTFGPSQRAAQLEGSKAFMKDFAQRHGIKTSPYRVLADSAQLDSAVAEFELPPVVKADGLCAGKGVVVAQSHQEAIAAAREMLSGAAFGDAGRKVVLEQRISGAEASIHAICDGERAIILPAAQDHKRLSNADQGPNTGGMGTYAPAPLVTQAMQQIIRTRIIEPVVQGMRADGIPFKGTLFAGLMVDRDGDPYLLEINVRFGDPETQSLVNVLQGDWAEVLLAAAQGDLRGASLHYNDQHAVCVVMAASGYPASVRKGDAITGLSQAATVPGVRVYHAGTARRGDDTVTNGGRVLGVTAVGQTLKAAQERAYQAVSKIQFAGAQYRTDIAHRALS